MNQTPDISVLLPSYNACETLPTAVTSILNQSHTSLELVVIDDGSTDATRDLLALFQARDRRVVAKTVPHGGIVEALNAGLAICRAPLVARMDADDWSPPERLARQASFLDAHPEVGVVGSRVLFGGDRVSQAGYAAYIDWINGLVTPEAISLNRFIESPFAHPSVMFRRGLTALWGSYRDGPFPEDYELWLRWLDAGVRMAKVDAELLRWDDRPGRLSRTDERYARRAFYACKASYLSRWLARHNAHHPGIIVWGAGRETRKRAEFLVEHGIGIEAYVDIDPRKIGQTIHGRPVLAEHQLPASDQAFVVSYVGSRGARDDIRSRLGARGFREGVNFIVAA